MVASAAVLALNQALFVGIYALLRLPPALGLVSGLSYHTNTPTMTGAFYGPCLYMRERLGPDQKILSLLVPHSYYCPQAQAIVAPAFPEEADYWLTDRKLAPLSRLDLAEGMERHKVAFVVLERSREYKSGPASAPSLVEADYSKDRMGALLQEVTRSMEPLYQQQTAAVYDGPAIIAALRR